MAGPLNGIGGQQIPLSTPFQPGGQGNQVRSQQDDKTPKPNQVQPQGAQPAQSQRSDSRNGKDLQSLLKSVLIGDDGDSRRGSVVDITV